MQLPRTAARTQVVSSTLLGAALGSFGGGGLADALGRRKSFLLAAIPMAVGPLLSATATSLNPMVAGRFLAGLAIGLSSALVPVYISEVGAAAQRCIHTDRWRAASLKWLDAVPADAAAQVGRRVRAPPSQWARCRWADGEPLPPPDLRPLPAPSSNPRSPPLPSAAPWAA